MAVPAWFAGADREAAPLGDRPSSGPWGHGALAWAVGTRGCTGILCWGSCARTLALLALWEHCPEGSEVFLAFSTTAESPF